MFLYLFLILVSLQFLLSIASVRSGFRFHKYVSDRLRIPNEIIDGRVTVFIPCRGAEPGLEQNLAAVLNQERKAFEVIIVVDDKDDEAVPMIRAVIAGRPEARLIVAGKARDCGQKVHNLLMAVEEADESSEIFVFADSDARPNGHWLGNLISPLFDETVGCSSGYRWFIQAEGGIATHLRSAWNASIATALGPDRETNFCWGGSMAFRRKVFEELDVAEHWKGSVSDDFAASAAIKGSRYGIHFEPKCLTATVGDCSWREMFEFTTRQMKITNVYSNRHFKISFIGSALFTVTFFPGLFLLAALHGFWLAAAAGLICGLWILGTAKAVIRLHSVLNCMPECEKQLRAQYFSHCALWPFSSVLFFVNDIAALLSRRITWRGVSYELVSENETKILTRV